MFQFSLAAKFKYKNTTKKEMSKKLSASNEFLCNFQIVN